MTVAGVDRLTVKLGGRENRLTIRQLTVCGMSANVRESAANRPHVRSARTPKKRGIGAGFRRGGIESFCVLPLTTGHKRLGELGFGRRERAAYPAGDVQFLGALAKLVALAIENAMAFREIAQLKDKLSEERPYLESEIRTELTFEHPGRDARGAASLWVARERA